jgi:hypothetical protein
MRIQIRIRIHNPVVCSWFQAMDVEPAVAAEGSAKPEEEAAPAVKKDTKLSLQFGPPKAGLEIPSPVFWVFLFFWVF